MLGLRFEKESKILVDLLEQKSASLEGQLSPYSRKYLGTILENTRYNVQLSAILLESVVRALDEEPANIRLVDYGGGIGLTSMLARLAGFKAIYYVDIYETVAVDHQRIATAFDLVPDECIIGDISNFVSLDLNANALVSRDVIEHIYDLHAFFRNTRQISGLQVQIHNTSANIYNRLLKQYFNKIHFEAEYKDIRPKENVKKGESGKGFLAARKHIIMETFPTLNSSTVVELARHTRGMNRSDIIESVQRFMDTNILPEPAGHSNTCEPETGNWAERLLTFDEYRSYAGGYTIRFDPAPYNVKRPFGLKKGVLLFLNLLLFKFGAGPMIWPSIVMEIKPLE